MKIFHRYILRHFLGAFFVILAAFIILYVAYDIASRVDELIKAGVTFHEAVGFYLAYIPQLIVNVVPIALIISISFSIGKLNRHYEILALRASGLSLFAISLSITIAGLTATLILFFISDLYATKSYEETEAFVKKVRQSKEQSQIIGPTYLNYKGGELYFDQFDRKSGVMKGVNWTSPEGKHGLYVKGDMARYLGGVWWLFGVNINYPDDTSSPYYAKIRMYEWQFSPDEIGIETPPQQMTVGEMNRELNADLATSQARARLLRLFFHYRVALPVVNLIVVILSLPLGFSVHRRGGLFVGLGEAMLLCFFYYVALTFFITLGQKGLLDPALAAWSPNILFGILAAVALWKLEVNPFRRTGEIRKNIPAYGL